MSTERLVLDRFTAPAEFQEGADSVAVTSEWIEDAHRRALSSRTTVVRNQDGVVVQKTVERWAYDKYGTSFPPTLHTKEIWSTAYIPKVNPEHSLMLVERETTAFWIDAIFLSPTSEMSYRTTREGYVVYDLYQDDQTATAEQQEAMRRAGRVVSSGSVGKRILSTARPWDQAVDEGSVVESPTAPQGAWWETISVKEHRVTETWALVMSYDVEKDYLRPGRARVSGPHYRTREGARFELPFAVDPPMLVVSRAKNGIRLEARSRGVVTTMSTPTTYSVVLRPEEFLFFRRVVSEPDPVETGNRWGILVNDPVSPVSRLAVPYSESGATDLVGVPLADSKPAQTEPNTGDDASEPPVERWESVGVVANAAGDGDEWGHATIVDPNVTTGAVYEYAAAVKVAGSESEMCVPVQQAYNVPSDTSARIGVTVSRRTVNGESVVDVSAEAPVDAAIGIPDYGETVDLGTLPYSLGLGDGAGYATITEASGSGQPDPARVCVDDAGVFSAGMRVLVESASNPMMSEYATVASVGRSGRCIEMTHPLSGSYDVGDRVSVDGLAEADLEAAQSWGELIARENMLRERGGLLVHVTPSVPVLTIRRGVLVSADLGSWRWIGDGVIADVTSRTVRGVVEGWSLAFGPGDGGAVEVSVGEISVEVVP